jgi:hypothetical protein
VRLVTRSRIANAGRVRGAHKQSETLLRRFEERKEKPRSGA